jgi:tetratricopeptide (TPR) repeat protein
MRVRLLLLAAALVAFGTSLGSGFHFDDYAIFQDPALASARGWLEVWAPQQTRPLTYFTFWINRQLGAANPFGYHLFNLLLHLAAVLLAWECLCRLLPHRAAVIAALLFAIHPLQAEAVDYVWARSIVLAAAFCFAALWAWIEGRVWLAAACFLAALLAKEECAAFPVLLAWLTFRSQLPPLRRAKPAIAAMLALALMAGARVIWATAITPGAPAGFQAGITPWKYFALQGAVIARYLQLLLLPYGFTVDAEIAVPWWLGAAAWLALLLVAWPVSLLKSSAQTRSPIATWTITTWAIAGLILLLPSSSLFPAADLSADRRMYLPLFAFAATAGLLLARLKPAAPIAIAAILLALSLQRTLIWNSDVSLWSEAVRRAPHKLRPKLQLARAVPPAQGLELLAQARLDAPFDPAIPAQAGRILLSEGQAAAALDQFGRALALAPMDARNSNNRGVALLALGQRDAARSDFEHALTLDPALAEARDNLASLSAGIPIAPAR